MNRGRDTEKKIYCTSLEQVEYTPISEFVELGPNLEEGSGLHVLAYHSFNRDKLPEKSIF